MKRAVMYGCGNIGRGFIGALFSGSGYGVTFIDVVDSLVDSIRSRGSYPLRFVSEEGFEDVTVGNVTAVNGKDTAEAADAITRCDIMAVAVGVRNFPLVVPNLVEGIRRRWALGGSPLNIIICENINDANAYAERLIKECLSNEECALFDSTVGLVETSIGRMVPVQTDEMKEGDPLRVCVERYGFLPVDKAAFKGGIPQIKEMVPYEPFDYFVKRKLFIHNMGHAVTAYLGGLIGADFISQAIDDPQVRIIVQNAMLESAQAISRHYGEPLDALVQHITDLLRRFSNSALKDTCARVGGDPGRKLSPSDRLAGASKMAVGEGVFPAYISVGIAAGVKRFLDESGKPQDPDEAISVLTGVCGFTEDDPVPELVMRYYGMIAGGCSIADLRRAADRAKSARMNDII